MSTRRELRHPGWQPPAPAQPGRRITGAALGVAAAVLLVDLLHAETGLVGFDPAARLRESALILFGAQAFGLMTQILAGVALGAGLVLRGRSSGRLHHVLAGLPGALILFILMAPRVAFLLSSAAGNGGIAPALVPALGLLVTALVLIRVAASCARAWATRGRLSARHVLICMVLAPACFLLDGQSFLDGGPVALHDLLELNGLICAALIGSRLLRTSWFLVGTIQGLIGVTVLLAVSSGALPGESRATHELLFGRTRVIARTLRLAGIPVTPPGVPDADEVRRAEMRRIAAAPEASPEEVDLLRSYLRRSDDVETVVLDELLHHPETEMRELGLLTIATRRSGPGPMLLVDLSHSGDLRLRSEAALGMALLGNDGYLEEMRRAALRQDGERRIVALLARYAGGESVLGPAIHQLVARPKRDRDLDTLGMAVVGRMGDPRGLVALYRRLLAGVEHSEQRLTIWHALTRFPLAKALPVLRLLMRENDPVLRKPLDAWLARHPEHDYWVEACERAELLARQERPPLDLPEGQKKARENLIEALDEMLTVRVLDWGLVIELAALHVGDADRTRFGQLLQGKLTALPGADDFARGLALRHVALGQVADREARVRLEPMSAQGPGPTETGLLPLLARVSVDVESRGLVGAGEGSDRLRATLLDSFGRRISEPRFMPLPPTAVLAGEEAVIAVEVLIDERMRRGVSVEIRLERGLETLAGPLMINDLR